MACGFETADGQALVGSFTAPVIGQSNLPALLGLKSMEAKRAVLDMAGRMLYLPGPGGFHVQLSPGSIALPLVKSESGHLLLPCSKFRENAGTDVRTVFPSVASGADGSFDVRMSVGDGDSSGSRDVKMGIEAHKE